MAFSTLPVLKGYAHTIQVRREGKIYATELFLCFYDLLSVVYFFISKSIMICRQLADPMCLLTLGFFFILCGFRENCQLIGFPLPWVWRNPGFTTKKCHLLLQIKVRKVYLFLSGQTVLGLTEVSS